MLIPVKTMFEKSGDNAFISIQLLLLSLLLLLVSIWDGVVLMAVADLLFLFKADAATEGVIAFDGG